MTDDDTPDNASGGGTSLEGYFYQVDISIWAALDLLLAKKLAQQLVLEPASKEDLEATLAENEPGRLAAHIDMGASTLLVLQAKLRNTGPWKVGGLASLLQHGTDREPAAERLKDPRVYYLLVTSADVDGVARSLRVTGFGERPKAKTLPATIAAVVPPDTGGRIGILASADPERVEWKIKELLEGAFRVPHSKLEACKRALRDAALERMRGVGDGVWTREQLEYVIKQHDGYFASSLESETFVKPTNWSDLKRALTENYAVIITGASGTGKTTAANVLLAELRTEIPGITPVHILHGPQEVRAGTHAEPVVFVIEDPWGKYRLDPRSEPWNDEIDKLLATANGNRRFIITSRSDVLAESHTRKLSKKWIVTLEAENYGPRERARLFEHRLPALPRQFQKATANYKAEAINRLRSPLEMQKYFDNLAEGRNAKENEREYIERCLAAAHRDAIEQTIVQQVSSKGAWPWAAVIWGLLKAQSRQSRALLPQIQARLGANDKEFEDGLEPFVNFMVNGRNLRQLESAFGYYHPRVEAGLENAMAEKPGLSARVLGYLVDVLIHLDTDADDWGHEAAARLVQALRRQDVIPVRVSKKSQAALDAWLAKRLSAPGKEFSNDLWLAADAGSSASAAAQLAKWLINMARRDYAFGKSWSPDPDTDEWYQRIAADPLTAVICKGFIRHVLPFQNEGYPTTFANHLGRLAPDLTPVFLEVASSIVSSGYDRNADAIAYGAAKDLAAFEPVLQQAIAFSDKLEADDDPAKWLAVRNGEYDEEYAEHLGEFAWEDGYTADTLIKTYVAALRTQKGWAALRDHPQLEKILYAWIEVLRHAKFDEAELLALLDKSFGRRHEHRFWSFAARDWNDSLAPRLLERLVAGHANREVRHEAAVCFAQHAAGLRDQLVQNLLPGNPRRLLEILLDLRAALRSSHDRPLVEPFINALVQAIPKEIADVAAAFLEKPQPVPVLQGAALSLVRSLDPSGNMELAVEKATLLVAAGDDASALIETLVRSPQGEESEDIACAADALKLAAARNNWPLVEASLSHRFAAVRKAALEALAARTAGPLPPNLLALAKDKGSGVRRALVGILKTRPAPEHLDALVTLAADDWAERGTYYGQAVDYPIAQGAAKVLQSPPPLPEAVFDRLVEIAAETNDSDVRWDLINAIAKNGGAKGIERVCALALSRESIKMSTPAAWALFAAADKVDEGTAARLTVEQVTSRNEGVSVFMAMAIGASGTHDQVVRTAKALSALPKRPALLVPLAAGAASQEAALVEEVARLLPPDREAAVLAALSDGPQLPRNALDDLGDVRIVEEILSRLSSFFVPKPK